jgi:uncharacterized protein YkwD
MLDHASSRGCSTVRAGRPMLAVTAAALLLLPAAPAAAAEPPPGAPATGDPTTPSELPLPGTDPVVAPPPAPAPAPVPAAAPAPAGDVTGSLPAPPAGAVPPARALAASCRGAGVRPSRARASVMRGALLCVVNRARANYGLRSLRGDRRLARAAAAHAADMARRRYFGHTGAGGRSPFARARAAGWRGRALGEALAYGCGRSARPTSIVQAWLRSPGHRAIVLGGRYGRAGIGLAKRAPVQCGGGATWVLDAGRR